MEGINEGRIYSKSVGEFEGLWDICFESGNNIFFMISRTFILKIKNVE